MTEAQVLEVVQKIMKEVPEALPSLGRFVGHLFAGDADKAALEARLAAETIAIKKAAEAPYELK